MTTDDSDLEIWPNTVEPAKYGLPVAVSAFIGFYLMSLIADAITPKSAQHARWKWKNHCISFMHAMITGNWAFVCFIQTPKLAEDMISTSTDFSHTLIAVSLGYFLFDIMDMLVYQRNKQSFELLGHHLVIACCFTIATMTRVWIGYATVALIFELNSIFLHLRLLLQICGFKRTDKIYRFNSLINVGTFIAFRMLTLAWMTRWIVANKKFVPLIFYIIGCLSVATMIVMNIVLFYRVLCSDFFRKKESMKKESMKHFE